jgi:hypothetical protein
MKEIRISDKILQQCLKPLLKYSAWLEAVYVYGSAITKKSANDIDVLIMLNDSGVPPSPEIMDSIEKECGRIEEKGRAQGMTFHFQPIKMLSRWWSLLLDGEPWIVSSLEHVLVIYDKKNLIGEVSKIVRGEILYRKEERAEKLIERSSSYALKNRQLLLSSLTTLANAATEAAQILLLFDNKLILNKEKIIEELERAYIKTIGEDVVGNYKEIIDLEEKMEKGSLSEFSAENLDYYLDKMKKFIAKVEDMLSKK